MPKPIKKIRVDMMAVLKNHELRIMVVEQSLYRLVQALSTATKGQTEAVDTEAAVQSELEQKEAPEQTPGES
jgi:hypothetical protein